MNDLPDAMPFINAARRGKLGLALSGGGFRAALFHVGVLAQMAEQDILRHVSVISTVSGGSIIGAFYYLKVKQLLEGNRQDKLTPSAEAYRQLVVEVEREFLLALQHNLRVTTFADRSHNARMLGDKYSPTMRLADLFNDLFYDPITGGHKNFLKDLPISPVFDSGRTDGENAAGAGDFVVPKLVLNCTALNSGQLFQFSGEFVGQPQAPAIDGESPVTPLLRRLSLNDTSLEPRQRARLARISVGDAVVASCCVPGLLDPFNLGGLYRDAEGEEVVVRLVDGGVCDNQGLMSLYEDDCSHFICSDASDLLKWQSQPAERFLNVAMRANEIMMDRIRTELLDALYQRGADKYAVFTLGDVAGNDIFPQDSDRLIKALSAIRTDLDAFTDQEAYSLMYYGFRLCGYKLGKGVTAAEQPKAERKQQQAPATEQELAAEQEQEKDEDEEKEATGEQTSGWAFSAIRGMTEDAQERERLLHSLDVGSRQFMKIFYLGKPLPYVIVVAPLLIPLALFVLLIYLLPPVPTSAWIVLALILVIGIAFSQNARIVEWLDQIPLIKRYRKRLAIALQPLGVTVLLGIMGAGATWINLRIFNKLFLKYGQLEEKHQNPLARLKRKD